MFFLHKFPDTFFEPVPLLTGSAEEFRNVMFKVNAFWAKQAVHNVNDWKEFQDKTPIPNSDSVLDYVAANPHQFYIPLLQELFNKIPSEHEVSIGFNAQNTTQQLIKNLPVVTVQPVVSWNNRGDPNDKMKKISRTLLVQSPLSHQNAISTTCDDVLSSLDCNNIDLMSKESANMINCIAEHCTIKPRKKAIKKSNLVSEKIIPKPTKQRENNNNIISNTTTKKQKLKSVLTEEGISLTTSNLSNKKQNRKTTAEEIQSNSNINDANCFNENIIISNTSRKRKQMQISNHEINSSSSSDFENSSMVICFNIFINQLLYICIYTLFNNK